MDIQLKVINYSYYTKNIDTPRISCSNSTAFIFLVVINSST